MTLDVDANLNGSDNVISGNEPSQEMLTRISKNRNVSKQVMPKSQDICRSLEIKLIWTFDTEFPTIFNKRWIYITFKSAVKHRQLNYGFSRGQTCQPGRDNH